MVLVNVNRVYILCQSKDLEKLNYQGHSTDAYVHKRMKDNKGNQ